MMFVLVYFDRGIYLSHKCVGANVPDGAAHDTQSQAEQRHVTEVKCRLEETVHSATQKTLLMKQLLRDEITGF